MREFRAWSKQNKKYCSFEELLTDIFKLDGEADKFGALEESTEKLDHEGIKIFQCDIVTAYYDHQTIQGDIIYKNCAYWIHREDQDIWLGSDTICDVKIVGNIHEPV